MLALAYSLSGHAGRASQGERALMKDLKDLKVFLTLFTLKSMLYPNF